MFKHIVMWKIKDHVEGLTKYQSAQKAKRLLEAVAEKVPQVVSLEVGIHIDASDDAFASDLVMISEFANRNDLQAYLDHPEHKKIIPFMKSIRDERRVVDYEA